MSPLLLSIFCIGWKGFEDLDDVRNAGFYTWGIIMDDLERIHKKWLEEDEYEIKEPDSDALYEQWRERDLE